MTPSLQPLLLGTALLVTFVVFIVAAGALAGFYMGRRQ